MKHLILVIALATPAAANDPFTAQALYTVCTNTNTGNAAADVVAETMCSAYFHGLTDGMFAMTAMAKRGQSPCMPTEEAISDKEAIRTFEYYFVTHPNTATNSAGLVASMALGYAYKCR
jgi:Rap1a immunity proteins